MRKAHNSKLKTQNSKFNNERSAIGKSFFCLLLIDLRIENTEQRASATAHLGISGTKRVQTFLYLLELRMEAEHTILEVVLQQRLPFLHGHSHYIATANLGLARLDVGEGLLGGNSHIGLHHNEGVALEVMVCESRRCPRHKPVRQR